jgi:hypothetical protein
MVYRTSSVLEKTARGLRKIAVKPGRRKSASSCLGEPNREARRRHALEPETVDLAAFAALDLELDVNDAISPVFLGFACQSVDCGLTVGFRAGPAGGSPGPLGPNAPD